MSLLAPRPEPTGATGTVAGAAGAGTAAVPSPRRPPAGTPSPEGPSGGPSPRPATGHRLIGLDLARALAVFGMFAAHVGPDPSVGGPVGAAMELSHGRASALFATLAGLSLALMTGRREPKAGLERRQAMARIVLRAAVLLALAGALAAYGSPVDVILSYYAVYFLLALPFLRLRARALAVAAAVWAVGGPLLSFGARALVGHGTWAEALGSWVPLGPTVGDALLTVLLSGSYPAMTWMPFVLTGLALGRADLTAARLRRRLAVAGPALAVTGYGLSWLIVRAWDGARAAIESGGHVPGGRLGRGAGVWETGFEQSVVPTDTPAWLLVASPHSGTPFEVIGNMGVAVTLIVAALAATDALRRGRRLLAPVLAVGTMSLTAYVGHIVAIRAFGIDRWVQPPLYVVALFAAGATAFAALWSRRFRHGPLEGLLRAATKPARFVR
ncbi:DUF418 domain-containing protein [Streptomyces sp. URMC 123]|uniref:DUF418 domain-containing protein n=1 Tax=Streptomyces sp. URMC 123 TaxID=3423403 RepID=UPI003F19554F